MLHLAVLAELLDAEMAVAASRHDGRCVLSRHGPCLHATLPDGRVIAFDGAQYDAEPLGVTVVDDRHQILSHERWPGALSNGEHPLHRRPFACIRGTAEYHTHPSHLNDRWNLHRGRLTFVDLLGHVLTKAQA